MTFINMISKHTGSVMLRAEIRGSTQACYRQDASRHSTKSVLSLKQNCNTDCHQLVAGLAHLFLIQKKLMDALHKLR